MYELKDYKTELYYLIKDAHKLYQELLDNKKLGIGYDVDLKTFKVSLQPKKCYKFNKLDLKKLDILIDDWINLVNFGIEKDYMGILQKYKLGLRDMIIALSPRFFYPAIDLTLKKDLIKTFGRFKEYLNCKNVNLGIRVQRTPGKNLMDKLEGVFKNMQEGHFEHSIYLHNALSEFNMFDQEKYYRAVEEGIGSKKSLKT